MNLQGKDETGKAIQDYWKPSLTLLADKELIAKLKSYDKDNISPKWVDRLPGWLLHPVALSLLAAISSSHVFW